MLGKLELCATRERVMERSAGSVEPNCHGRNIATGQIKRYLKRYLVRKMIQLPIVNIL